MLLLLFPSYRRFLVYFLSVCSLKQMLALKCAHVLYCPIKMAFFLSSCVLGSDTLTLKLRVGTLSGILDAGDLAWSFILK